jgi:glutamate racemase
MIGVFDSGLGGLTILKEFIKEMPNYDYIYLGDNARTPYGNKSQETINEYTRQAVDFLFLKGCELIIIACNTASAQSLRKIQREYLPAKYPNKKVLGVIRPLVEKVAVMSGIKKVGVLGTKATISSDVYKKELQQLGSDSEICQQSASLLVPLIEEGWTKKVETKIILKRYLQPLKQKQIQMLILACTHYPFLLDEIRKIMSKRCLVLNPGEVVAASLKDYLDRHSELGIVKTASPYYNFYTTDEIDNFVKLGEKFLGRKIINIEKINLI